MGEGLVIMCLALYAGWLAKNNVPGTIISEWLGLKWDGEVN